RRAILPTGRRRQAEQQPGEQQEGGQSSRYPDHECIISLREDTRMVKGRACPGGHLPSNLPGNWPAGITLRHSATAFARSSLVPNGLEPIFVPSVTRQRRCPYARTPRRGQSLSSHLLMCWEGSA